VTAAVVLAAGGRVLVVMGGAGLTAVEPPFVGIGVGFADFAVAVFAGTTY